MKELSFTKRKFLKLELRQQHKKCSHILRMIYEKLLNNESDTCSLYKLYHQCLKWMDLSLFSSFDLKEIADCYHEHLQKGIISLKEHNLLPHIRKGDHQPKEEFGSPAIYLDRIRSAYNVGSILRTTEALRIGSVYFHPKTPFINNEKVIKTSMGSSFIVPCFQNTDLSKLPRPWIALETSSEGEEIFSFIFPDQFTLFIGNEEYGISDELLKEVNYIIDIPIFGVKNSINAACAYSIAAAEIRKQRDKK